MSKPFSITFKAPQDTLGQTVSAQVPPPAVAHAHGGKPGSLLHWADSAHIEIDHACGGFAACSTCHVIVRQGFATCNDISDEEADMLDQAPGLTPLSRLACQCVPNGSQDVVVEIPAQNRNRVREGK